MASSRTLTPLLASSATTSHAPSLLRCTSTPIRFDDKDWAALIQASERDALQQQQPHPPIQTRRRLSSYSESIFSGRSSSAGESSQLAGDSGLDSLTSPHYSEDESTNASSSRSTPAEEESSSVSLSSSSEPSYAHLGARPRTRSRTIYKRYSFHYSACIFARPNKMIIFSFPGIEI